LQVATEFLSLSPPELSRPYHAFITIFVIFLCYLVAKMKEEYSRECSESRTAQPLILDHLEPDPVVARRLSPGLAFRHRALPVAERDHGVTVAMADPSDAVGRAAVAVALGTEPCVVQSDAAAIDVQLSQIWPQVDRSPSSLLAYVPTGPHAEAVRLYAEYVGDLLGACLDYVLDQCPLPALIETASDYELVICGEPDQSFVDRLLRGALGRRALDRLPTSLLFVRHPHWSLRRLLLVVQGEASDDDATDWALRLAASSGASVTVLAVVPPVPAMYHGLPRLESGLAELLTAGTALGRQMRRVAKQLVDANIEGKLRLREGEPVWEVRREAAEGGHDMVAVAATRQGGLRRLLLGDLAISLLPLIDRPLLIAR
jgi:nucleotide-binding universal stress UspA family protein